MSEPKTREQEREELEDFSREMVRLGDERRAKEREEFLRNPDRARPRFAFDPPCPFEGRPREELTVDERYSLDFWDSPVPEYRRQARAIAAPPEPTPGELSPAAAEDMARFCQETFTFDEYASVPWYEVLDSYRNSPGAKPTKGAGEKAVCDALIAGGLLADSRSSGHFRVCEADDDGLDFKSGIETSVPPTRWIVPGVVPTGAMMMFVADEGALKTTTAVWLAAAVAHGRDWLGRPTERTKTAIVNWDGRNEDLLMLLNDAGAEGKVLVSSYPEHNLDSDRFWRALEAKFGQGQSGLIVIDSLSRGSGDVDEKDARFARPVLRAAEFAKRHPVTFLWIHHSPKTVKGGDWNDWVRGTSALGPAIDIGCTFSKVSAKTSPQRETIVRMEWLRYRIKGTHKPAPVRLRMTDAGLGLVDEEVRRKAPLTDDEKVLAAIITTPGMTLAGIEAAVDFKRARVIAARQRLEDAATIENRGTKRKPRWFAA